MSEFYLTDAELEEFRMAISHFNRDSGSIEKITAELARRAEIATLEGFEDDDCLSCKL